MNTIQYIICIMCIFLVGCEAISFRNDTFYGLTLNSNIESVERGTEFVDIFAKNNLEIKKFGPTNPMTYSIFEETNASQITVSVSSTGFITVLMRERRFGSVEVNLCKDLKSVLDTLDTIKSNYDTSINQENIENSEALLRCA